MSRMRPIRRVSRTSFCGPRYELHSAFRTVARMIRDDFRVHWARVFLFFLLLACRAVGRRGDRRRVLAVGPIGVNGPYLCARYERDQRNRARD